MLAITTISRRGTSASAEASETFGRLVAAGAPLRP
jgi:hypothetical protein